MAFTVLRGQVYENAVLPLVPWLRFTVLTLALFIVQVRAALRHVVVAEVGAVLVLAGLGVAAGAGADQGVLQVVPLLQDAAVVGVDDHERTRRRAAARRVGEVRHDVRQVRAAVVVDEDHLLGLLVLDAHAAGAVAEAGALAERQGLRAGPARRLDRRQFAGQAVDLAAEQVADVAVACLR